VVRLGEGGTVRKLGRSEVEDVEIDSVCEPFGEILHGIFDE
jgi:hypothetical protein